MGGVRLDLIRSSLTPPVVDFDEVPELCGCDGDTRLDDADPGIELVEAKRGEGRAPGDLEDGHAPPILPLPDLEPGAAGSGVPPHVPMPARIR